MLRTTIKKNLASPTPKQNDELAFSKTKSNMRLFVTRDVVSKKNQK